MPIRKAMSAALIALASAGFVSAASAQGLSRAEVRQQLVEAEANGSPFVSNASYPDVSQAHQQPMSGYGPAMAGSSAAGNASTTSAHRPEQSNCTGPASFCTNYSGG
jgi:hypothetical protein